MTGATTNELRVQSVTAGKRRICIVVTNRASYARIRSAVRAVHEDPRVELQLVLSAAMVLEEYGDAEANVYRDGFEPAATVHCVVEGNAPADMARTTGLAIIELTSVLEQLRPDIVLSVADRFETMGTAIAAAYMNIPLAHTQGGEVTGSIDESVRHAITKLAVLHFPATRRAARNIIAMGEPADTVHLTGCPCIDNLVDTDLTALDEAFIASHGLRDVLNAGDPYLLVIQHAVTTEFDHAARQVDATLTAVTGTGLPAIWVLPNMDAGSNVIAKHVRQYCDSRDDAGIHLLRNMPVDGFARLMKNCACIVGNSSAAIREGSFLGAPAVNIGTRHAGHERGHNVIDAPHDARAIRAAIDRQIAHGPFASETIYGDGGAGPRIAAILATADVSVQKRLTFTERTG